MRKYYMKHVSASGFESYRVLNLLSLIGWVMSLYPGETITLCRDEKDGMRRKMHDHPKLFGGL